MASCFALCPCRLMGLLQLTALVVFCIAWPVIMNYMVFLFDCHWNFIAQGQVPTHVYFTEHSECAGGLSLPRQPQCSQAVFSMPESPLPRSWRQQGGWASIDSNHPTVIPVTITLIIA